MFLSGLRFYQSVKLLAVHLFVLSSFILVLVKFRSSRAVKIADHNFRFSQIKDTIMSPSGSRVYQKYIDLDYKAFVFATHPTYGILLLHCTRKKKKGPHFQSPGGHVDKEDYETAASTLGKSPGDKGINESDLLLLAGKIGAARELFEETGLNIRTDLDRLQAVHLRDRDKSKEKHLYCEMKERLFFKLCLKDDDFVLAGANCTSLNSNPPDLRLRLSHEHQGFKFVASPKDAVGLLVQHSGGKVSKALQMAIEHGEHFDLKPR